MIFRKTVSNALPAKKLLSQESNESASGGESLSQAWDPLNDLLIDSQEETPKKKELPFPPSGRKVAKKRKVEQFTPKKLPVVHVHQGKKILLGKVLKVMKVISVQTKDDAESSQDGNELVSTAIEALKGLAKEDLTESPMTPKKAFAQNVYQQVRGVSKQLGPKSFFKFKSSVTSSLNSLEAEFMNFD